MYTQLVTEIFNEFLDDMNKEREFCSYLDVWDYEDEYSHNQIEEYRTILEEKIRNWLADNKPNKYYMFGGAEVTYIMTNQELLKRNLHPHRYQDNKVISREV